MENIDNEIFEKLRDSVSQYQDLRTVIEKVKADGYYNRLYELVLEIFSNEHIYSIEQIKLLEQKNQGQHFDFQLTYDSNQRIFKSTFNMILNQLVEDVSKYFSDEIKQAIQYQQRISREFQNLNKIRLVDELKKSKEKKSTQENLHYATFHPNQSQQSFDHKTVSIGRTLSPDQLANRASNKYQPNQESFNRKSKTIEKTVEYLQSTLQNLNSSWHNQSNEKIEHFNSSQEKLNFSQGRLDNTSQDRIQKNANNSIDYIPENMHNKQQHLQQLLQKYDHLDQSNNESQNRQSHSKDSHLQKYTNSLFNYNGPESFSSHGAVFDKQIRTMLHQRTSTEKNPGVGTYDIQDRKNPTKPKSIEIGFSKSPKSSIFDVNKNKPLDRYYNPSYRFVSTQKKYN